MTDPANVALMLASAFGAGVLNAVAGGGTLLTFPALMNFGGLVAVKANGTSTVALVPGSLASAWGYRNRLAGAGPWLWLLLPPSLLGGVVGALLMTRLPAELFGRLVPWLILVASVLFLLQPALVRFFPPHEGRPPARAVGLALAFFQLLVSVYGGYFGAGIGILMLSSLGLMGVGDIHRMNALKTLLAAAINAASIVVFVIDGMVEWAPAALLAAGSIAGGYAGAHYGQRLPRRVVRWFVIALGFGLSAYYFARPPG